MPRFLIDANLPYYFSLWKDDDYIHQFELGQSWSDSQIWEYAKSADLVIVTKDADFYTRVLLSTPPPKVIFIRLGNMRLRDLYAYLFKIWPLVTEAIQNNRLVVVYSNRIEVMP